MSGLGHERAELRTVAQGQYVKVLGPPPQKKGGLGGILMGGYIERAGGGRLPPGREGTCRSRQSFFIHLFISTLWYIAALFQVKRRKKNTKNTNKIITNCNFAYKGSSLLSKQLKDYISLKLTVVHIGV